MTWRLKPALVATASLCAHAAVGATCSGTAPNYAASAGGFGVLDGQIYFPDGEPFTARGIDIMEFSEPPVSQLLAQFPGLNFVRLAIYDYANPATLAAYINQLTAAGVVVELEDHNNGTSVNAGGGQGTIFTGSTLTNELNWYSSISAAFKTNPYVWFGTNNEPAQTDASGNNNPAALSAWQQQTYQAIRAAGNNNPIMLEMNSWGPSQTGVGYNQAAYAGMTNTIWDVHYYGWVSGYSTNQGTVNQTLSGMVSAAQQIKSADGTMPVILGEYGPSTTGPAPGDPNGSQVVQAVQQSGLGSVAWAYGQGGANSDSLQNSDGSLSAFGQSVAAYLASGGSVGCAQSPVAATFTDPAVIAAQAEVNAANNLTVADVAALAAQGQTADGSNTNAVAQLAATGPAPGGVTATDPTTAAVLAQGPVATVTAPIRTVNSPGGTSTTPAAATTSTSFIASSDFQTIATGAGNVTGTVSGNMNTISATGGIATITVTGTGNQIATGPYDDTITVSAGGNTINAGGGNDTIILAYPGSAPPAAINADAPALPPLAGAGNIFVAPALGTGTLTIQGTLAKGDTIDVTKALVGLAGYNGANVWQYLSATASPSGCVLSVNGTPIIILPNGSPSGNIGSFITASAL